MAYNLLLTVLLFVLVSISLTSGYSHPTRDVLFKQESYSMATSVQGSSLIDVEDLVKARSLQALLVGSKVAVNKASKSTSFKSSKKRKHKSKVGPLDLSAVLVVIIIAAIVVTICVIYFFYLKHKTKKAESLGQEKTNGSSENQTSKTEDIV